MENLPNGRVITPLIIAIILCCAPLLAQPQTGTSEKPNKIRVLVVTGGHDFEREPFYKLFQENPEISFQAAEHPNAYPLLEPGHATNYDVLVAYDMRKEISPEAQTNLLGFLKTGRGLVVLHHALCAYQHWPEYSRIIGGHYYLEPTVVDGVSKPRSTYQHDLQFRIQVINPEHPVTRGLADFVIHDEAYKLFDVDPDAQPLLTTDEPNSNKVIAWTKAYGPARVVYLQSGHDHFAYENPNYQRLVRQAIRWTARRAE